MVGAGPSPNLSPSLRISRDEGIGYAIWSPPSALYWIFQRRVVTEITKKWSSARSMNDVNLPAIVGTTTPALQALTDALGVPRTILASDDQIIAAWNNLPRVMSRIPPDLRSTGLVRMCVAVSAGLFDSAINYVWNASVLELRQKIRRFGLNVVEQVIGRAGFDETKLLDLKDSELLDLCLKLNLITEDGFFFLDQCRDIRNNFSAAHPTMGDIDDHEFISFVNRCAKYALGNEQNPIGVDISGFVAALKAGRFAEAQLQEWVQRLRNTHEAQRELLFGTLQGMYCDPASAEETRINALSIIGQFIGELSPRVRSDLIDRHQDYLATGDQARHVASQQFFEKLSLLELLGESERHALISNACKKLYRVHQAFDNFYNEPPFAERVWQLSSQGAIPNTVKDELVTTVITCAVGNPYGISHAAYIYYQKIIQNFSPAEIAIMLALPNTNTVVAQRIKAHLRCKEGFKNVVRLVNSASVPTVARAAYEYWVAQ